MLSGDDYLSVLDAIDTSVSVGDISRAFGAIIDGYGLQNIAYLAINVPQRKTASSLIMTTYDPAWAVRYRDRGYILIDPVVRLTLQQLLPLAWEGLGALDPRWESLFEDAQAFRVGRQGLSFPIYGVHGDRGILTITANTDSRDWASLRRFYLRDVPTLAAHIHERTVHLAGSDDINPLGPREVQCVQGIADGRAPKAIADDLGISESGVRKYLNSARHKLGCVNRDHLITRAVTRGIVADKFSPP